MIVVSIKNCSLRTIPRKEEWETFEKFFFFFFTSSWELTPRFMIDQGLLTSDLYSSDSESFAGLNDAARDTATERR